jgi:hypothetical protein
MAFCNIQVNAHNLWIDYTRPATGFRHIKSLALKILSEKNFKDFGDKDAS